MSDVPYITSLVDRERGIIRFNLRQLAIDLAVHRQDGDTVAAEALEIIQRKWERRFNKLGEEATALGIHIEP